MVCVMQNARRTCAGLLAGLALFLPAAGAAPLRVLTTTPALQSLAAEVAGPHGQVDNWLAGGGDPHDFQFTARDLRRLREADVLIVNGLGLETWLQRAIERAGRPAGLRVVEAAAGIPESQLILGECSGHDHDHDHHHHAHAPNPHVWLDPVLARHLVTNIVRVLVAADPAHAGAYEANAAALDARLAALHGEFERRLAPVRARAFIVFHDAFPYLVRRYALRQVGVVEEAASVEPSARHLTALGATVRAEGVRVMFLEPGARSRLAQRLARDWNLRLATLDPLETSAESGAGAYEAAMRRNLDALVAALQPAAL